MASFKDQLERFCKEWKEAEQEKAEQEKAEKAEREPAIDNRRHEELLGVYRATLAANGQALGLYHDIMRALTKLEIIEKNLANAGLLRPSRCVVDVLTI